MEKWLEKKIVALCNIIMEHMPHTKEIIVLDAGPDLTTDYGHEQIVFIRAIGDGNMPDSYSSALKAMRAVLTSAGDYAETAEVPIRMNSSVIFPITFLM